MKEPNLFLIGAPKCGTTALAHNLAQHLEIYVPSQKEPRFFDKEIFYDDSKDYVIKNLEEYLLYYSSPEAKNSQYRLDASVFNMYSEEAIENILRLSPEAKFIIILRDPVEATISMFHQRFSSVEKKLREISEDFQECWDSLEERKLGKSYPYACCNRFLFRYDLLYSYQDYVPYLKKRLGSQLLITFYEDYKDNPKIFYKEIFHFLELDNIMIDNRQRNKSQILKNNILLQILYKISKWTFPLRKRLGIAGKFNIQKNVQKKFQKEVNKKIQIAPRVYDFFAPSYAYLAKLKKDKKI